MTNVVEYMMLREHIIQRNIYNMYEYENYNFAVLQLYDDLLNKYGYVGLKTIENIEADEKQTEYGYTSNNDGSFRLTERSTNEKQQQDQEYYSRSGVLIKQNQDKYSIVGLKHLQTKDFLSQKIKHIINQWTEMTTIDLAYNNIGAQGCKYLSQFKWRHLTYINLDDNNISAQGCKYLSQANWTHLTYINLAYNNIGTQGCKYLSQTNCRHLTFINLCRNNIDAQGCKYLSQVNWIHLKQINLAYNNIKDIVYRLLLLQVHPTNAIKI